MSTVAFAVPLPGRCLHPSPEPQAARFEVGARVVWLPDREEGTVGAVTRHAVCIHWDESQYTWYPLNSLAARERIAVLGWDEEETWV